MIYRQLVAVILATAVDAAVAADLHEVNPPAPPRAGRTLVLTGARLIDGRGGPPIEDSAVIVRGTKIIAAGPRAAVSVPPEALAVSLEGKTILPGFVDSHFHSVNDLALPARFLAHGVTAIRDPGHPIRFYQAVKLAEQPLPRAFLTGGHLDGFPPIWPQEASIVKTPRQAAAAIDEHVARGASGIKIYFRLPLDLFPTVCETADRHGVPVTAHLELVDADDAIRSGVDGIEHITSFGTALALAEPAAEFKSAIEANPGARRDFRYRLWANLDLDSGRAAELCQLVVSRNIYVSPTLAVFERRAGDRNVTEMHVSGFQQMLRFAGMCHRAGATLVAGSHSHVPHADTGFAFQRELELLVEAGLTPLEAITAGTWNNAKFFGAERRLGSVEPGKLADLVVVAGNPAEDIRATYDVRYVMLNGSWVAQPE